MNINEFYDACLYCPTHGILFLRTGDDVATCPVCEVENKLQFQPHETFCGAV